MSTSSRHNNNFDDQKSKKRQRFSASIVNNEDNQIVQLSAPNSFSVENQENIDSLPHFQHRTRLSLIDQPNITNSTSKLSQSSLLNTSPIVCPNFQQQTSLSSSRIFSASRLLQHQHNFPLQNSSCKIPTEKKENIKAVMSSMLDDTSTLSIQNTCNIFNFDNQSFTSTLPCDDFDQERMNNSMLNQSTIDHFSSISLKTSHFTQFPPLAQQSSLYNTPQQPQKSHSPNHFSNHQSPSSQCSSPQFSSCSTDELSDPHAEFIRNDNLPPSSMQADLKDIFATPFHPEQYSKSLTDQKVENILHCVIDTDVQKYDAYIPQRSGDEKFIQVSQFTTEPQTPIHSRPSMSINPSYVYNTTTPFQAVSLVARTAAHNSDENTPQYTTIVTTPSNSKLKLAYKLKTPSQSSSTAQQHAQFVHRTPSCSQKNTTSLNNHPHIFTFTNEFKTLTPASTQILAPNPIIDPNTVLAPNTTSAFLDETNGINTQLSHLFVFKSQPRFTNNSSPPQFNSQLPSLPLPTIPQSMSENSIHCTANNPRVLPFNTISTATRFVPPLTALIDQFKTPQHRHHRRYRHRSLLSGTAGFSNSLNAAVPNHQAHANYHSRRLQHFFQNGKLDLKRISDQFHKTAEYTIESSKNDADASGNIILVQKKGNRARNKRNSLTEQELNTSFFLLDSPCNSSSAHSPLQTTNNNSSDNNDENFAPYCTSDSDELSYNSNEDSDDLNHAKLLLSNTSNNRNVNSTIHVFSPRIRRSSYNVCRKDNHLDQKDADEEFEQTLLVLFSPIKPMPNPSSIHLQSQLPSKSAIVDKNNDIQQKDALVSNDLKPTHLPIRISNTSTLPVLPFSQNRYALGSSALQTFFDFSELSYSNTASPTSSPNSSPHSSRETEELDNEYNIDFLNAGDAVNGATNNDDNDDDEINNLSFIPFSNQDRVNSPQSLQFRLNHNTHPYDLHDITQLSPIHPSHPVRIPLATNHRAISPCSSSHSLNAPNFDSNGNQSSFSHFSSSQSPCSSFSSCNFEDELDNFDAFLFVSHSNTNNNDFVHTKQFQPFPQNEVATFVNESNEFNSSLHQSTSTQLLHFSADMQSFSTASEQFLQKKQFPNL